MIPHEAACQFIFIFKSEPSQFPVCFFSILLKIFWQSFSKLSLGEAAWKPARKQKASYTSGSGFWCSRRRLLSPTHAWGWGSEAQTLGCRSAALLAVPFMSYEWWAKDRRSLLRLNRWKFAAWEAAATSTSQSSHRGQVPVQGLPSALSVSPSWLQAQLVVYRKRKRNLAVGFLTLLSALRWMHSPASCLPGPALAQVAEPEPLLIICCSAVKNGGHFPADRAWREEVFLLPSSWVGARHPAQTGCFV